MSLGACLVANDPKGIGEAMIKRRIDGVSWKDIADEFDLGSPGAARNYFKKVTGIADFKAKGKALEQLLKDFAEGGPAMGANTATKAVKAVADSVNKTPVQLAEQAGLKNAKWKSTSELAKDLDLTEDAVEFLVKKYEAGEHGYTALKSSANANGHYVDFAKIDEVVWNTLLQKHEGKTWAAYASKPTSETGFNAVKKKVLDLHAKGLSAEDIAKIKEAPPEGVVHAIIKDKWQMPPMGATKPIIPPPPPAPPEMFSGALPQGTNYKRHSNGEMQQWVDSLGQDLTEAQAQAVRSYTGSGYHSMNGWLRGESPGSTKPRHISGVDGAMRPLPFDTVVTRNVSDARRTFGTTELDELVGATWRDPAYMSTTIVESGVFGGSVQMIINVAKGFKARYVRNLGVGSEYELLLARGSKFVIHKVEKRTGSYGETGWRVYMEMIEQS